MTRNHWPRSDAAAMNETAAKEDNEKVWLWSAVTEENLELMRLLHEPYRKSLFCCSRKRSAPVCLQRSEGTTS